MFNNLEAIKTHYQLSIELEMVKKYIRIEHSNDDTLLEFLTNSAVLQAEKILQTTFGKKEYIFTTTTESNTIILPQKGTIEILCVKAGNNEIPFKLENNRVQIPHSSENITIHFTCENKEIPDNIKSTMMVYIFFLYEERSFLEHNTKAEKAYINLTSHNYKI